MLQHLEHIGTSFLVDNFMAEGGNERLKVEMNDSRTFDVLCMMKYYGGHEPSEHFVQFPLKSS